MDFVGIAKCYTSRHHHLTDLGQQECQIALKRDQRNPDSIPLIGIGPFDCKFKQLGGNVIAFAGS